MFIPGRVEYSLADGGDTSASSSGSTDTQTLEPADGSSGVILSVESPPIRVTFGRGNRPSPKNGIRLDPGTHFLPIAEPINFVSLHDERPAHVNAIWLRFKPSPHEPASAA